jgi:TonB family protein
MQALRNSFRLLGWATLLALTAGTAVLADETPTISTANAMVRATKKVSPEFPIAAKQLHIIGAQDVQVTVSKTGDVIDAKVLKGNAMFSNSSMAAAKQWKFAPLVKDGTSSEFTAVLVFNYGQ